ncbi:MAG TPA: sialidase family protein [Opitutaceae bacterium]|nr:sialidase family protein [Opitutaceae bacterium]
MHAALVAKDCCAWPSLTVWPDGTLGLVHFDRPSHGRTEGNLAALVSRDHGATWADARFAAPREPATNRMHIASGRDQAGRWLVLSTGFRFIGNDWAGLAPLWCSTAAAPGEPWAINRAVAAPECCLIPHGRIRALADGRLATTFYRAEGREGPSRAWLVFSTDGGASWVSPVQIGDDDANEVVLLPRPTGDWLAIARTQRDHHLVLWRSPDGGATWGSPLDLTPRLHHPGDLTDLGDGRLLLTFGIRTREQAGIGYRLSHDAGLTWDEPVVLHAFGPRARDCGYPSTVRCADGALLTACYSDHSLLYDGYHLLTLRWSL